MKQYNGCVKAFVEAHRRNPRLLLAKLLVLKTGSHLGYIWVYSSINPPAANIALGTNVKLIFEIILHVARNTEDYGLVSVRCKVTV